MSGRPRSFDRDVALDCALEAFWRDGYADTSVAELTGAMGIGPPSLYAAFGDKQRLFEEAAAQYIARLRRGVADSLAAPTAAAAVRRLLEITAQAHGDPATPPGCLVFSEPTLQGERDRVRQAIAERIARGRSDGDVPVGADAEALAAFLEAVIAGMSHRAREGGAGLDELVATARLAADAVCVGWATSPVTA